jgi:hypothetical protein
LGSFCPDFLKGGTLKKVRCHTYKSEKKSQVSTLKKNLGKCYPKKFSGGTL